MRKRFTAFILLFLVASVSHAATWSLNGLTIKEIITGVSSDIVVKTEGGAEQKNGCVVDHWVFSDTDENKVNRVYSMLLAAQSSGKQIKIYNTEECAQWSYHGIYSVKTFDQ